MYSYEPFSKNNTFTDGLVIADRTKPDGLEFFLIGGMRAEIVLADFLESPAPGRSLGKCLLQFLV
jgi:hypothetical protein